MPKAQRESLGKHALYKFMHGHIYTKLLIESMHMHRYTKLLVSLMVSKKC